MTRQELLETIIGIIRTEFEIKGEITEDSRLNQDLFFDNSDAIDLVGCLETALERTTINTFDAQERINGTVGQLVDLVFEKLEAAGGRS